MPPHPPKHEKRHHVPASRALRFVDDAALDAVLIPLVSERTERSFVKRCLVEEGPIHHRGANYVLLRLLARALEAVPGEESGGGASVAVPMRLPPHLEDDVESGDYPLRLPTSALEKLVGGDAASLEAAVDCLTDGPPQHALANVVMVAMLEKLLARLEKKG